MELSGGEKAAIGGLLGINSRILCIFVMSESTILARAKASYCYRAMFNLKTYLVN